MNYDTVRLWNIRHSIFCLLIDNYQKELAKASFTNESLELHERMTEAQMERDGLAMRIEQATSKIGTPPIRGGGRVGGVREPETNR